MTHCLQRIETMTKSFKSTAHSHERGSDKRAKENSIGRRTDKLDESCAMIALPGGGKALLKLSGWRDTHRDYFVLYISGVHVKPYKHLLPQHWRHLHMHI